jgi:ABC-type multidrug transport system fused ATPase/permease subunit
LAKKIGYVSQDIFILEDSFINNIAFGVDEDKIDFKKSRICNQKSKNK